MAPSMLAASPTATDVNRAGWLVFLVGDALFLGAFLFMLSRRARPLDVPAPEATLVFLSASCLLIGALLYRARLAPILSFLGTVSAFAIWILLFHRLREAGFAANAGAFAGTFALFWYAFSIHLTVALLLLARVVIGRREARETPWVTYLLGLLAATCGVAGAVLLLPS